MTSATPAPADTEFSVSTPALAQTAYVKVLQFAAHQAKSTGVKGYSGFTLDEIHKALPSIEQDWLVQLLPSICTVRINGQVKPGTDDAVTDPNARFVIKSEEYLKLIDVLQLERVLDLTRESRTHFTAVAASAQESATAAAESMKVARKSRDWSGISAVAAVAALVISLFSLFRGWNQTVPDTLRLDASDRAAIQTMAAALSDQSATLEAIANDQRTRSVRIDDVQFGCLLYAVRVVYRDVRCPPSSAELFPARRVGDVRQSDR